MSTLRKDSGQMKVKTRYLKAAVARNEGNFPYNKNQLTGIDRNTSGHL